MDRESTTPREGAYYAVPTSNDRRDSSFHVIKVLKVDAEGVHVRQYEGSFNSTPDISALGLDVAIGHVPLSRTAFERMKVVFIEIGTVSEDELEGYRIWEDEGGGFFA